MELEFAIKMCNELTYKLDQYAETSIYPDSKHEWYTYIEAVKRLIELNTDVEIYLETRQERYDDLNKIQCECFDGPDKCMNMGQRMQIVEDMSLLKRRTGVWNDM